MGISFLFFGCYDAFDITSCDLRRRFGVSGLSINVRALRAVESIWAVFDVRLNTQKSHPRNGRQWNAAYQPLSSAPTPFYRCAPPGRSISVVLPARALTNWNSNCDHRRVRPAIANQLNDNTKESKSKPELISGSGEWPRYDWIPPEIRTKEVENRSYNSKTRYICNISPTIFKYEHNNPLRKLSFI